MSSVERLERGWNPIRISYTTKLGGGSFAVDLNQYLFDAEGILTVRLITADKRAHVRVTSGARLDALLDIIDMSDGGGVMTADEERIQHALEITGLLVEAREHVQSYRAYLEEDAPQRAALTDRLAKIDRLVDIMRKRYGSDVGLREEAPADEERAQAVTLPVLVGERERVEGDYADAREVLAPWSSGRLTVTAQARKGHLVTRGGVAYLIHHVTGKGCGWVAYVAASGVRLPQTYRTRDDAIAAVSRPSLLLLTPQLVDTLRATREALLEAVELNPTITAKAREALQALRVPEPITAAEPAADVAA